MSPAGSPHPRLTVDGMSQLPQAGGVLTHCNTGALATGGVGTALGCIVQAYQSGKKIEVFADETRPLLQGARLTALDQQLDKATALRLAQVEMAAFADENQCTSIVVSEHHASDDGYLPSPLTVAAAMAAVTTSTPAGSGSSLSQQWPYWPRPPDCFLCTPRISLARPVMVSR